ncbi:mucin-4-like [Bactrocera neohumeralis]|uniref:mucin-4-like n=1 Tax=Bactrocera neohumeralis TaxID=98809 RepID=UPI002165916A|nr:mucin-4-like [Bactrocera neohumeralis]
MGNAGSSNRSDPHRSPPHQSYQYYEQARPQTRNRDQYDVSGSMNEASMGPRIVVHGSPYMDRPSQYEVRQRTPKRMPKHSTPKSSHSGAAMCVREYGISLQRPQAISETSLFSNQRPQQRPPPTTIRSQPQQQQQLVRSPIESCNCKACRDKDEKLAAYAGSSVTPNTTYVSSSAANTTYASPIAATNTTNVSPIEYTSTPTAPKRNACTTANSCTGCSRGGQGYMEPNSAAHSTAFDRSLNDTSRERNRRELNEASVEHSGRHCCKYEDESYANTSTRRRQSPASSEIQTTKSRGENHPITSTRIHECPMANETQSSKYRDEAYPLTSTRIHNNAISRESEAYKYRDETYADTSTRMSPSVGQTQASPPAQLQICYDGGMTTSGGATSDEVSDFHRECLDAHNRYRARHQNCPPLSLSNELSKYAQQWAQHLAATGRLEHRQVHTYGENLYTSSGMEVDGATVVKNWYDEIRNYDFSKATYKPGTGHFTQIVWRDSRQLGVGIATRADSTYVVCNYNPPGNILGSFDGMVPPLK